MSAAPDPDEKRTFTDRMLDRIETVGNKVPHPALIFAGLCVFVIVLSWVLSLFDVSVTYEVAETPPISVEEAELPGSQMPEAEVPPDAYEEVEPEIRTETTAIESLISVDGIRFIFTSFVQNFANFSVVAVIFVAMIGVGVAEKAGLMAALIRKLVSVAPARAIAFIIVLLGVLSSVASDAGYLILIPLGAAAFVSLGRHPLAGLAAAYAGVSAVFAVNVLITPIDSLLTEITNEAIGLVPGTEPLTVTANLWFSIVSTFFIALVVTVVTERVIEPRLGAYHPEEAAGRGRAPHHDARRCGPARRRTARAPLLALRRARLDRRRRAVDGDPGRAAAASGDRRRHRRLAVHGQPDLHHHRHLPGRRRLLRHRREDAEGQLDVINAITETFASLAGLIFMLLLISQFIAYFNFSNMPTVLAASMADLLERADIGAIWLLILFILVIALLDIIIPGVVPKWAIFAPIFIPLFLRLDVAPQTVLAAYRVADSPMNVITPLMVYLPFIVVVAQRYKRDAGLGTVISLMLPYTLVTLVVWTLFFIVWYLLGIPFGPGYPVHV